MRLEMAAMFETVNYMKNNGNLASFFEMTAEIGPSSPGLSSFAAQFIPRGWIDQNQAALTSFYLKHYIDTARQESPRVLRDQIAEIDAEMLATQGSINPYNFMQRIAAPSLTNVFHKVSHAAVEVDLMILACALERYFIDEKKYPARLEELAPKYIAEVPADAMTDQPLKYSRTDDGRYRIYSLGWDGDDDGGVIARRENGRQNEKEGDWVWRYDPKAEPVE